MKLPAFLRRPEPVYSGVMGVFAFVDDATAAVTTLRASGHRDLSIYSPVPFHALEQVIEQGPSLVRWICFAGGVAGITAGFGLCIYSVISWPLVVGGKELISLPPFVVIGYESMILLGALANLMGMLALARLPQVKSKAPYDPRFSLDKIGIWVPCAGDDAARVEKMLRGQGAEEVKVHA